MRKIVKTKLPKIKLSKLKLPSLKKPIKRIDVDVGGFIGSLSIKGKTLKVKGRRKRFFE